jgi:secreted trypsin-like serine protease
MPDVEVESQAIVGGTATTEYPAVAQLSMQFTGPGGDTFASCSSTLISPRVILTAAHCLDSDEGTIEAVSAYFGTKGGTDPGFVQSIPASDWDYLTDWTFGGNDIALVLLEYDSDVEPMLYNSSPLGSNAIGANMHVVGWGNTMEGSGGGTKRHMTTPITSFQNNLVLKYGTTTANTCQGDSGGPGFLTFSDGSERVVGITSFGTSANGDGCLGSSGSTRVGQYNSYISNYIAANDIAQAPVVEFVTPIDGSEVQSGFQVHVEATDNTRVEKLEIYINGQLAGEPPVNIPPYIISAPGLPDGAVEVEVRATDNRGDVGSKTINVTVDSTCDGPQDCGGVLTCNAEGLCVSPDFDLGSVCEIADECDSGICATVEGESLCTSGCVPDQADGCPADFECLRATETEGYCWPGDGGGSESGGCSTGGSSGIMGGLFILLALAWRRRR